MIVHDLDTDIRAGQGDIVIAAKKGNIRPCIGCFGCWLKTPGKCVINDDCQRIAEYLVKCDEFVIISECVYGGYSPYVKTVFDRSIGYLLPFFTIREDGMMHHKIRMDRQPELAVHFYGADIRAAEKETAEKIVERNAANLNAAKYSVDFCENDAQIGEAM